MVFETELSGKLNNELEVAGVSVSEELIAKTLAAVQAARTTEGTEIPDTEWVEASEENAEKLIELAQARKGRLRGAGPALFRVATVMAACFVLVVGGFVLHFSTMRMGKDSAAPMAAAENGNSARNGVTYAADGIVEEDFKYFSDAMESQEEESTAAVMKPADSLMEPVATTAGNDMADDAEAVTEAEKSEDFDILEEVKLLTEQLAQAESVEEELTGQGTSIYRFVVREDSGESICYLIHETGEVEFAEMLEDGENGVAWPYGAAEDKEFRRSVLVWMKQNGYGFDAE